MEGDGREGQGRIFFLSNLTLFFFDIQFKDTSNFQSFKVPSKSFFPKNFKTGLTF